MTLGDSQRLLWRLITAPEGVATALVDEPRDAARLADETGDLLFTCVNLARKLGIDPETALRHGNAKFEKRFRHMEAMLLERGQRLDDVSFAEKEAAWRHAKRDTAI